jgi:hypothetical protein
MKLENPHESYQIPQESKCLAKEIILDLSYVEDKDMVLGGA